MEEDIRKSLKPQKPTFVDDAEQSQKLYKNLGSDDANGGMKDQHGNNQKKPHKHHVPISSVDVDELMNKKIDLLTDLAELEQIEAMAMFQRLVEDLIELSKLFARIPNLDLRKVVFGGMASRLTNIDTLKDAKVEFKDGKANGASHLEFPALIKDEMSKLVDSKREENQKKLEKLKSQSNEELGIPLKKSSKMDSNFDELEALSLTTEDLSPISGKYHLNLDPKLCEEISQRFYLKKAPQISLSKYLERINRFLSPSPAVLLTASYLLFNMAFNIKPENDLCSLPLQEPAESEGSIKMTFINELNVFRVVLSVLRVSLKLIEDQNYKQAYYCKVTGMRGTADLFRLEFALIYILGFNLFVNEFVLTRFIYQFKVFDANIQTLLKQQEEKEDTTK